MTFKASGLPGVVPAVPAGIATAETWGDVEELARHVRIGRNAVHHATSNDSAHGHRESLGLQLDKGAQLEPFDFYCVVLSKMFY